MATLAELEDALVNADKAGDKESARILADEIVKMRAAPAAKKTSTTADVLKSARDAIPRAVTGIAGFPGDMLGMMDSGVAWLLSKQHGGKPEDYRQGTIGDYANSDVLRKLLPWQLHEPQTRAGKATDTAVQTAAMMGRNWLTAPKAAATLTGLQTAGTEGAGALTNDDPLARALGGLLATTPAAFRNQAKTQQGVVVRDALGELTPEQIARAQQLQSQAQAAGVPLMGNESLDVGHQLASAVYASPSGNKIIEPFMRQRPERVGAAVNRDLIAKTGPRATPDVNAARAQEAATNVIKSEERARAALTSPWYKAAEYETIPRSAMRSVANEFERQIFAQPAGSAVDKTLGNFYKQAFPEVERRVSTGAASVAKKAAAAAGVNPNKDDIVTAIRRLGGINPDDQMVGRDLAKNMDFGPSPVGAVWRTRQVGGNLSNTKAGHGADEITRKLFELGYVDDAADFNAVLSKMDDTLVLNKPHYSAFYEPQNTDPLANAIEKLVLKLDERKAGVPKTQTVSEVVPETRVGALDLLSRNMRAEADIPQIGATGEQKMGAVPVGRVADELSNVLTRENANLRRGRELHKSYTETVIDPLVAGPVGKVAGKSGFDLAEASPVPRITSAIADSSVVRPQTIRTLYGQLNKTDRQAFPGIVQTHLENRLNEALADLRSGPAATAGQKFRQAIAGTPQDRANFDEMMRGVAIAHGQNPAEVVRGANNLLDVLERTGRTPGIGSQTTPRGEITRELGKTKTGDILDAVSTAPLSSVNRRLRDWVQRGRNEELARALTAPDSVDQLVKLGKYQPNTSTASWFATQILGLQNATAGDQSNP